MKSHTKSETRRRAMDMEHEALEWREQALHLAWKLQRAHNLIDDVGAALGDGDEKSAQRRAEAAHNAVNSVARAIEAIRGEPSPEMSIPEPDAVGSTLAIGGSGVATLALDVKVNAMMALAATHDQRETDFLIGVCADAESAYEVAAAVVEAAPRRHGAAVMDLRRAFETAGGIALRERVIEARPRVREIYERTRRAA
jgi:hypothetical protein